MVNEYLGVTGEPGKSLAQIAKERGVKARNLYLWMLAGLGDEKYQEVVTQCLVCRIADADEQLAMATNQLEVQKYREVARFARMDFERRRPSLYGQKAVIEHTKVPGMDSELAEGMKKLLEMAAARVAALEPVEKVVPDGDEADAEPR